MAEEKYYVLTVKDGYDLRHHDFERAPDGTLLFTKDQAKQKVASRALEPFMPVAVPAGNIERLLANLQAEQAKP